METLLHIGQHKTGTTSIQRFLHDHRDAFAERGVYVPGVLGDGQAPGHALLNVHALARDRYSPVKHRVVNEYGETWLASLGERLAEALAPVYDRAAQRECRTVLWSNEGLYLLDSVREYGALRRLFDTHSRRTVAVCCFREVDAFRSSYSQHFRTRVESPPAVVAGRRDSWLNVAPDSWLFDYGRKRRLLETVFDDFIEFAYDPEDNIGAFLSAIGLEGFETAGYRLNVSA